MRQPLLSVSLAWALALLPACTFTVDGIYVNENDDGGSDNSTSGGDGGASTGAATGGEPPNDGGETSDGGSATCVSDDDCETPQICERRPREVQAYCTPDCDDGGTCRSRTLDKEVGSLVSDLGNLCVGTLSAKDAQGRPLDDAGVYVFGPFSPASYEVIGGQPFARALFVVDGSCYFATGRGLMRAALVQAEPEPELVGATDGEQLKAWFTAQHVWWSHPVQSGDHELWRIAREKGAEPERFAEHSARWESGSSKVVVRLSEDQTEVIAAPLSDLSAETVIGPAQPARATLEATRLVVHGDALYYAFSEPGQTFIRSLDLNDPAAPLKLMNADDPSPADHRPQFFFYGASFLWAAPDKSGTFYRVLRAPLDLDQPSGVVARIPKHSALTLMGTRVVYRAEGDTRFTGLQISP